MKVTILTHKLHVKTKSIHMRLPKNQLWLFYFLNLKDGKRKQGNDNHFGLIKSDLLVFNIELSPVYVKLICFRVIAESN